MWCAIRDKALRRPTFGVALVAAVALLATGYFARSNRHGWAFIMGSLTIALATVALVLLMRVADGEAGAGESQLAHHADAGRLDRRATATHVRASPREEAPDSESVSPGSVGTAIASSLPDRSRKTVAENARRYEKSRHLACRPNL